jgi:sigma-B regulation protein RsbU (phosphoserine phosphatase)
VLESFLEDAFRTLREDLRLRAGLLFAERPRRTSSWSRRSAIRAARCATELDPALPPLQLLFRHRVYIFADPRAEGSPYRSGFLPALPAAAVLVGRRPRRHAFVFVLADGWQREELDFTLNTVRAALGSRLADERVRGSFRDGAEIQQSLLLEEAPDFSGFDIACRSLQAEEVGGDFYDFLLFDDETLGFAIGDASGHGLQAALQVRDVVTGLRMGMEKNLKIAVRLREAQPRDPSQQPVEPLRFRVLRRARAGRHDRVRQRRPPAALLFRKEGVTALAVGGTVIGPLPEARFRRGIARLEHGETLCCAPTGSSSDGTPRATSWARTD